MTSQVLAGWGRTQPVVARVVPSGEVDLTACWRAAPGRGVLARGLGRSYGDAAQNAGGLVVHSTDQTRVEVVDSARAVVRATAGTTLDELMRWGFPRGWFVPVTPGTRYVTVGGAVAADIHGKNHHRDGSIGRHVSRITLDTPAQGRIELAPGTPAFDATVGGMGLTGVIVDVDLALLPVETSAMRVDTERVPDLDTLLGRLGQLDRTHRYTVAWIDLLARGRQLGRGVITAGEHALVGELDGRQRRRPLRFDPHPRVSVPPGVPAHLLNPVTVAAFNEVWFRRAPRRRVGEVQALSSFFHPLDGVQRWNRLYGPPGFVQYQFVVPDDAVPTLRSVVEKLAARRAPAFLAVLKRFGAEGPGMLSFPRPGWTLAVDLPADPGMADLLDRFDDDVVSAGGRVYLAKDGRLRPRHLPAMYPRLDRWRQVRHELDPRHHLTSDLDRRLGLTGPGR